MRHISYIIIFFATLYSITTFGQKEALKKNTSKGKNTGYKKVFLDDKVNPTDSSNAFFYGYDLYNNGKLVFKFYENKWKYNKIIYDGKIPQKGRPQILTGTFKWYKNYGINEFLETEATYKDGNPVFVKTYIRGKKAPTKLIYNQVYYYDKLYNNILGTYYYEEYFDGKLLNKKWFRKGKVGWKCYEINNK